jgi:hypothetical protein
MKSDMIGKYVIARCRDAGVHAGILKAHEGREALLTESRRLWYWKPADGQKYLSGVAIAGLHEDSKIGATLPLLHLTETCELILCTDKAAKSIAEARTDER